MNINQDLVERTKVASYKAIKKWGIESQLDMMREEATELLMELARLPRKRTTDEKILEEVVDTYIMVHEMICIYGEDKFNEMLRKKLERFESRL